VRGATLSSGMRLSRSISSTWSPSTRRTVLC
jgi:hypothetical protein